VIYNTISKTSQKFFTKDGGGIGAIAVIFNTFNLRSTPPKSTLQSVRRAKTLTSISMNTLLLNFTVSCAKGPNDLIPTQTFPEAAQNWPQLDPSPTTSSVCGTGDKNKFNLKQKLSVKKFTESLFQIIRMTYLPLQVLATFGKFYSFLIKILENRTDLHRT